MVHSPASTLQSPTSWVVLLLAVRVNQYRPRLPSPPAIIDNWGQASCRGRLVTYAFILPDTSATKKVTGGDGWSGSGSSRRIGWQI